MTIQQCKYVLKIVESGSFNEAAKKLFIAQSSLSSAIKELENELGISIFDRNNKGVKITKAGAEFIEYAKQLISQVDEIGFRYSSAKNNKKKFSISSLRYDFIADVFIQFLNQFDSEDYKISIYETKTYNVVSDVSNLECELGILFMNLQDSKVMQRVFNENKLEFHPVFNTTPHVYVGKKHPLASKKTIEFDEIITYPYVTYSQGDKPFQQFAEELFEHYNPLKNIVVNDRATLTNIISETDCITIGTGIVVPKLSNGNIVAIPVNSDSKYTVGYIIKKGITLSEAAKEFVELFEKMFAVNKK